MVLDVGVDGKDVAVVTIIVLMAENKAEAMDINPTLTGVEVEAVVIFQNHKTRPTKMYAIGVEWGIIGLRHVKHLVDLYQESIKEKNLEALDHEQDDLMQI